jgi:hypothetical protein
MISNPYEMGQAGPPPSFAQKVVHRIEHLISYAVGLLAALVDDYTLITLLIFCVLLGVVVESALIPATAFFGLYFLMRLAANVADAIGFVGKSVNNHAQATLQIAAATARLNPPQEAQSVPEPPTQ